MKPCLAMDDLWPRMARLSPPSILTDVRTAGARGRLSGQFGRIMLVQELTVGAEVASRLATALARRTDALLDVVAVIDAFSEVFAHRNREAIRDPERFLSTIQTLLDVQVHMIRRQGIRCVGTLLVGAPPLELARHATASHADLMVVRSTAQTVAHLERALEWRALPIDLGAAHATRWS
jgi:nucleotide-binding universal stress UspA family protein